MKVRELIELLSRENPDSDVLYEYEGEQDEPFFGCALNLLNIEEGKPSDTIWEYEGGSPRIFLKFRTSAYIKGKPIKR